MSNSEDVLRPRLYQRLCEMFDDVKVNNHGQPCEGHLVSSPLARSGMRLN